MSTLTSTDAANFDIPAFIVPLARSPSARRAVTGASRLTHASYPVELASYAQTRRAVHAARGRMLAEAARWIAARVKGRAVARTTEL